MTNDGPFVDIATTCRDCWTPFVIGAGEAQFFTRKLLSLPTRCPRCREMRRQAMAAPPPPPRPSDD